MQGNGRGLQTASHINNRPLAPAATGSKSSIYEPLSYGNTSQHLRPTVKYGCAFYYEKVSSKIMLGPCSARAIVHLAYLEVRLSMYEHGNNMLYNKLCEVYYKLSSFSLQDGSLKFTFFFIDSFKFKFLNCILWQLNWKDQSHFLASWNKNTRGFGNEIDEKMEVLLGPSM
ncbi:hypothetical protein H5410_011356 [Solanum commersonii]|uniref:Uncharacterized protein n=1 Tax=Solanum commersonii TaxID=4109 RepID=A0A9J6APQ0_SOLCO|nr:hypothetical protein H5410_011356 [Solanum commersonii]